MTFVRACAVNIPTSGAEIGGAFGGNKVKCSRDTFSAVSLSLSLSLCIYIYIYVCVCHRMCVSSFVVCVRRRRAAVARPAATRGSSTCVVQRARSTTATRCRSRRASTLAATRRNKALKTTRTVFLAYTHICNIEFIPHCLSLLYRESKHLKAALRRELLCFEFLERSDTSDDDALPEVAHDDVLTEQTDCCHACRIAIDVIRRSANVDKHNYVYGKKNSVCFDFILLFISPASFIISEPIRCSAMCETFVEWVAVVICLFLLIIFI